MNERSNIKILNRRGGFAHTNTDYNNNNNDTSINSSLKYYWTIRLLNCYHRTGI